MYNIRYALEAFEKSSILDDGSVLINKEDAQTILNILKSLDKPVPVGYIPNLVALCFSMGYQGGTIHQVARDLGVTVCDILNADEHRMGELLRLAQNHRINYL